jgi:hypothetical protein
VWVRDRAGGQLKHYTVKGDLLRTYQSDQPSMTRLQHVVDDPSSYSLLYSTAGQLTLTRISSLNGALLQTLTFPSRLSSYSLLHHAVDSLIENNSGHIYSLLYSSPSLLVHVMDRAGRLQHEWPVTLPSTASSFVARVAVDETADRVFVSLCYSASSRLPCELMQYTVEGVKVSEWLFSVSQPITSFTLQRNRTVIIASAPDRSLVYVNYARERLQRITIPSSAQPLQVMAAAGTGDVMVRMRVSAGNRTVVWRLDKQAIIVEELTAELNADIETMAVSRGGDVFAHSQSSADMLVWRRKRG